MPAVRRGSLEGRSLRVAVVVSRFNEEVTERLLEGALRGLTACGVVEDHITVDSVPGAIEIPLVAQARAREPGVDAVVALGAVIRGETSHYDVVCRMVADGCREVSLREVKPVALGVLTTEDEAQARARAGDGDDNKGYEAARVAVELANLLRGACA